MTQDVTDPLERAVLAAQLAATQIDALTQALRALRDDPRWLAGPTPGAPAPRLLASSPVDPTAFGSWGQRNGQAWWDASPYAQLYGNLGHYHTGADLNLSAFSDAGAPVYAAADGVVRFAGIAADWQQKVVIIEHIDAGARCWTRYAHISITPLRRLGETVKRGDVLGLIADYGEAGPKGDHLHFDVAVIDLGARPADWPGADRARVLRDYLDPLRWLKEHQA